ncbi:unannotated protein [freshwater metagenome]|uniref:Unannotated protein n=1 Tax=freshwater metagenome TaxID=449393 RepID=A0A6J7C3Q4_9ZZZZ
MPDVDALGATDPRPRGKWLMDVAEENEAGLSFAHVVEDRATAELEATRDDVICQLGKRGWDVCAQDVDLAEGGHLGGERLLVDLVGGVHRTDQPASDEPHAHTINIDDLAVENCVAWTQVIAPEAGNIDVPIGQICGGRHRGEQLGVLLADLGLHEGVAIPPLAHHSVVPEPRRPRARLGKVPGSAKFDEASRVLRAKQVGEDPL